MELSKNLRPESLDLKPLLKAVLFDWDGTLLDSAEADRRWIELYAAEAPGLISGAAEALARLRAAGLATGLVTSGSRSRVQRDLGHLGAKHLFDVLVCSEDAPKKKPHPDPLWLALERLSVAPHEAVCVGDSPEDIEMARSAGVFSVAIAGAFPNREALKAAAADFCAATLGEAVDRLAAMARNDRPADISAAD